ncbi:30S ribosomal protein S3, partial [Candidatus Saccharibacteria bacterium]|nr:30S ribosomal protein S3 [Candidatus Saccharibacteria bacterium]
MGQKVNPISMRLQVHKNWRSRWFTTRKEYVKWLSEDIAVRKAVEKRFETRAVINQIDIERSANLVTIAIHTSKAGVVIGRGGTGVQ